MTGSLRFTLIYYTITHHAYTLYNRSSFKTITTTDNSVYLLQYFKNVFEEALKRATKHLI